MACQDTSALETYALMPSPILRRKCWLDGEGVYCKGTIWQSSMRLESQCAFFYITCFNTGSRVQRLGRFIIDGDPQSTSGVKTMKAAERSTRREWKTLDCSSVSFFRFYRELSTWILVPWNSHHEAPGQPEKSIFRWFTGPSGIGKMKNKGNH